MYKFANDVLMLCLCAFTVEGTAMAAGVPLSNSVLAISLGCTIVIGLLALMVQGHEVYRGRWQEWE